MSASYNQPFLFGTNAERLAWIAAHPGSNPGDEDAPGGIRWFETDTGAEYIWDWNAGAWVQSAPVGAAAAPVGAQYLTLALDATLTAERRFVDGVGLTGTDGGANGDYTLDLDINGLVAEAAADNADTIAIYDDTAGAVRKQTRANFLSGVSGTDANVYRLIWLGW